MSLPPEIWRRILREATTPPGGLVTSWDYSPSERIFQGWEVIDFVDPEIQTKRTIVLVCRQWRSIGVEFLYQWVRFDGPRNARALIEVFRAVASDTHSNHVEVQPSYGWWVRRVDAAAFMVEQNQLEELLGFLGLCSRVETVFAIPPFGPIAGDHDLDLAYLQAARFQHSLLHLRLRTPRSSEPPPHMTLTTLTSLSLAFLWFDDQIVPDWHFPSLKFLKLFYITDPLLHTFLPFLKRHGSLLIGLHIRTEPDFNGIRSILGRMSSLQSLVLSEVLFFNLYDPDMASYPSISHVGVQTMEQQETGDGYTVGRITVALRLILLGHILPSLKVLRLVQLEDTAPVDGEWSELSVMCVSANITLCGKE